MTGWSVSVVVTVVALATVPVILQQSVGVGELVDDGPSAPRSAKTVSSCPAPQVIVSAKPSIATIWSWTGPPTKVSTPGPPMSVLSAPASR